MVNTLRNILLFVLPFALSAVFSSCEMIDERNREFLVDSLKITTQRALLVEYTGWRCPNCPRAAEKAHALQESNPNGLIIVEFHPATNGLTRPDRGGKDDYTCAEADAYYLYMNGTSTTGFPTGVFDLAPQADGTYFTDEDSWGAQMIRSCQRELMADPIAEVTYNAQTRRVQVSVAVWPGEAELKEMQCVVWITEDSIVGQQYMPDGSRVKDYVHNHVLRQVLTDIWGIPVPLVGENALTVEAEGILREEVVAENAHVVVLLMVDKRVVNCCRASLIRNLI